MLYVDPASRVCLGEQAGLTSGEEQIDQWQCEVHLIVKASTDAHLRKTGGVQLPEELIDRVAAPIAYRLARKAPLVALREPLWTAAVTAGACGFVVGHDRDLQSLVIRREEKGRAPYELRLRMADLTTEELEAATRAKDLDAIEQLHESMLDGLIDRLLRFVSDDVMTEPSVLLALELALAVDPSFFAPPSRSSLSRIATKPMSAVSEFEGIASKIAARSHAQEKAAKAIVDALLAAPPDADQIDVPVYGRARRETVPALALQTRGTGASEATILLPAYSRWVVEDVEVYRPEVPPVLSVRESVAEVQREARGFRSWLVLVAIALVLLAVAVIVLLRAR